MRVLRVQRGFDNVSLQVPQGLWAELHLPFSPGKEKQLPVKLLSRFLSARPKSWMLRGRTDFLQKATYTYLEIPTKKHFTVLLEPLEYDTELGGEIQDE